MLKVPDAWPPAGQLPSLTRILAVRITLVAFGISLLLMAFFLAKYMLDTPNLRRLTLEKELSAISAALRNGQDPTQRPFYHQYPAAYGFRVFDRRLPQTRRLVAIANAGLLPSGPLLLPSKAGAGQAEITEGFGLIDGTQGRPEEDRWILTDHEDVGQNSFWIQVTMIGDPAWRWRTVIADEMMDHVVVPVFSIVPPLTIAMLLTMRIALRPLDRIAGQAARLGAAASSGERLTPLVTEPLPAEIHQVVSAINVLLAQLDRTLLRQKQFTSDAAHELRTPLAVLLLQLDELPPGPAVQSIREGLRGMAALVGRLLLFAQAEDLAQGERGRVDVGLLARKVCEELAGTAIARDQVIEFDAPGHLLPVAGHASLIETAIRNVVDNALKYSPPGTVVSVRVDAASELTVEDQGPGVREEQKELIFNRFWRADRGRAEGAGIGLALVRRIVQLHGGEARAEDRPGGGTRFTLNFRTRGQG